MVETEEESNTVSLGEFEITHYCIENYPHICNNGDSSQTASGQTPIPDYTVATDKSIPFGTKLIIDGTEAVKSFNDRAHGLEQALVILAECETDSNMVEVVQCKDCVRCHEAILTHWCNWWEDVTELNGYCSYGERREK